MEKSYAKQKWPIQLTGRFNSFKQREVQHAIHNENTDSELQGWCSYIIYPSTVLYLKNFAAKMIKLDWLKMALRFNLSIWIFRKLKEVITRLFLLEILFGRRSGFIAIEFRRVIIITSQCAVFGVPSIITICPWQGKCQTISRIIQGPTNNDIVIEWDIECYKHSTITNTYNWIMSRFDIKNFIEMSIHCLLFLCVS